MRVVRPHLPSAAGVEEFEMRLTRPSPRRPLPFFLRLPSQDAEGSESASGASSLVTSAPGAPPPSSAARFMAQAGPDKMLRNFTGGREKYRNRFRPGFVFFFLIMWPVQGPGHAHRGFLSRLREDIGSAIAEAGGKLNCGRGKCEVCAGGKLTAGRGKCAPLQEVPKKGEATRTLASS